MIMSETRELAALICAVAASTDWRGQAPYYDVLVAGLLGIDRGDPAVRLSIEAWCAAGSAHRFVGLELDWPRARDAEAEALLRSGWSP